SGRSRSTSRGAPWRSIESRWASSHLPGANRYTRRSREAGVRSGVRPREVLMQITVTFRHVDPTPALRAYAEDKVTRVARKYMRRPTDAHVILAVSKQRHIAEITLQGDHVSMFAKETTHDLYSAIDLAVEKIDHQAQKRKARRSERKG